MPPMHRRKTKLARRMNRVLTHRADRFSKALERSGIRTTYELHDRILSNRSSRRLWAGDHVQLDGVQLRVLGELDEQGYSLLTFGELFPDPPHWQELEAMRDRFVAETEGDLAAGGEHLRVAGQGVRRPAAQLRRRRRAGDPWFRACLSRPDARRRQRLPAHVVEAGVPRRLVLGPQPATGERGLLSALAPRLQRQAPAEGVPPPRRRRRGHGPFQYVPEPARRTLRGRVAVEPLGQNYPSEEELEGGSPPRTCARSPAEGLAPLLQHRRLPPRGFSTSAPRVLATVTYASPASLASLTERSFTYTGSLEEARRGDALRAQLTTGPRNCRSERGFLRIKCFLRRRKAIGSGYSEGGRHSIGRPPPPSE